MGGRMATLKIKGKSYSKFKEWYITEKLGEGAFSWVKLGIYTNAWNFITDKVALKFIRKTNKSRAIEQMKFIISEIGALMNLSHENVIKLRGYDFNTKYKLKNGKCIDTFVLMLEYAEHGSLIDVLTYSSQTLHENVSRTYLTQLINGVEYCHKLFIVHRDLKPANLLLDSYFDLKIADFGLCKVYYLFYLYLHFDCLQYQLHSVLFLLGCHI